VTYIGLAVNIRVSLHCGSCPSSAIYDHFCKYYIVLTVKLFSEISLSKSIEFTNCVKCLMCLFTKSLLYTGHLSGFEMLRMSSSLSLCRLVHLCRSVPLFDSRCCMDNLETILF